MFHHCSQSPDSADQSASGTPAAPHGGCYVLADEQPPVPALQMQLPSNDYHGDGTNKVKLARSKIHCRDWPNLPCDQGWLSQ